jgi:N-acetylmuramoyl-L-alanine amidase
MKVVLFLAALCLCFASVARSSSTPPLQTIIVSGREYVSLEEWAARHHFQAEWIKPAEELRLFSRWSNLRFSVNQRKAELNGVTVFLSVPIAFRNGTAYIAPLDLNSAVHPVLFPPKSASGRGIKTICLDPGHGGKDPGNTDGANQEKQFTLALARELGGMLQKAGLKVVFTRTNDAFIALTDRAEIAARHKADLFVSLHFNAAAAVEARGIEVYCLTPALAASTNARGEGAGTGAFAGNSHDAQNMLLAYHVQRALVTSLSAEDRGVRRARFSVLREAAMPAVMIEGGFMSHPSESRNIYEPAYQRRMARAIADGIFAYKKRVEP